MKSKLLGHVTKWAPYVGLVLMLVWFVMLGTGNDVLFNRTDKSGDSTQSIQPDESVPQRPVYTREELLAETNKYRKSALVLDSALNDSAQRKCEDMAARNVFEHGDWRDYLPKDRAIGENLAKGFYSAESVAKGWFNSPAHKANLLNERFTRVGFGLCKTGEGNWVVQHFTGEPSAVQGAYTYGQGAVYVPYDVEPLDYEIELPEVRVDSKRSGGSNYNYSPVPTPTYTQGQPYNGHPTTHCVESSLC